MLYTCTCCLCKEKDKINNNKHLATAIYQLHCMQLQKEVKSNPKQPSCKKCEAPKKAIVTKCEIQDGSQEVAVMLG